MILDYEFGWRTNFIVSKVNERANDIISEYGWISVNALHEIIEEVVRREANHYGDDFLLMKLVSGRPFLTYVDEKRGWWNGEFQVEVFKEVHCPHCGRSTTKIKVRDPSVMKV